MCPNSRLGGSGRSVQPVTVSRGCVPLDVRFVDIGDGAVMLGSLGLDPSYVVLVGTS
jgi:hypothetical protein